MDTKVEIYCVNGHILKQINNGYGTKYKKTRCSECRNFGNNNFRSCESCKYNMCQPCQEKTSSSRQRTEKASPEDECLHQKEQFQYNEGILEKDSCKLKCGREGNGFFDCTCGVNYCKECYSDKFPEEREKYVKSEENVEHKEKTQPIEENRGASNVATNANSRIEEKSNIQEGECHFSQVNNLKYILKNLDSNMCVGGCGRTSLGYMECVCGKKFCIICFEANYTDEKGKYPPKQEQANEVNEVIESPPKQEQSNGVNEVIEGSKNEKDGPKPEAPIVKQENPENPKDSEKVTEKEDKAEKEKIATLRLNLEARTEQPPEAKKIQRMISQPNTSRSEREERIETRELNEKDFTKCRFFHDLIEFKKQNQLKICTKCHLTGLTDYYHCAKCNYTHCLPCRNGEVIQPNDNCCIIF